MHVPKECKGASGRVGNFSAEALQAYIRYPKLGITTAGNLALLDLHFKTCTHRVLDSLCFRDWSFDQHRACSGSGTSALQAATSRNTAKESPKNQSIK